MTAKYLSKEGDAVHQVTNCPYDYSSKKNIDPTIPQEFQDNWSSDYCSDDSYDCEDDGQFKMDFEFAANQLFLYPF